MADTTRKGVIYKITCNSTNKSYIGQAKTHKLRYGKPFKYGSSGRWSDHKSSARSSNTPLAKAIKEHGADAFTISDLQIVDEPDLDAREAYWIEMENTLQPRGYNVMSHSRNKHNKDTELYQQYVGKVAVVEIHPVKKDGDVDFLYIYMIMLDGSSKRITFGQNSYSSVEDAMRDATLFAENLDCEVKNFMNESYKQQTRTLYALSGEISEVTITSASSLVAVYIMTTSMTVRKDQLRVCFGGKKIKKEDAYLQALDYIKTLPMSDTINITDKLKINYNQCQQQAAASEDEVDLQGENSVTTSIGSGSPPDSVI